MALFDVKATKKEWFIAKTQCQDQGNWIIKKATQSITDISAAFYLPDPILTMRTPYVIERIIPHFIKIYCEYSV